MKAVALVSGGIDSPVAAHLIAAKDVEVLPAYFDNRPFTGEDTMLRARSIVKHLQKTHESMGDLAVFAHGPNLKAFSEKCEPRYACVLCKRMMERVACMYAEEAGADFIVKGDSLAQVASQTAWNIKAVSAVATKPIIRPVIGLDKLEIIKIAKGIGTFPLSTSTAQCCTAVPKQPATKATIEALDNEEKKVDIKALAESCLASAKKA